MVSIGTVREDKMTFDQDPQMYFNRYESMKTADWFCL
jgi:hypothetical protein